MLCPRLTPRTGRFSVYVSGVIVGAVVVTAMLIITSSANMTGNVVGMRGTQESSGYKDSMFLADQQLNAQAAAPGEVVPGDAELAAVHEAARLPETTGTTWREVTNGTYIIPA
jgi:hypothetical protein